MNGYIVYQGNEEIRKELVNCFNKIYKDKKLNDKKNQSRTFTYNSEVYKEKIKIKINDNTTIETTYNTIQDYLSAFMNAINQDRSSNTNDNINKLCKQGKSTRIKEFKNKLNANYDKIKRAGEEDVYYILAKHMDNADITNVVNLRDKKEQKIKRKATASDINPQELMAEAVEVMGQQYVKNVSTYSGSDKYTLKQVSKDVDTAYIKNQYNTLTGVDISEQKEEIIQKFDNLIDENDWFKCGDDCVRFMFSVIFYANNGDLGTELSDSGSEKYYTAFGTNVLTKNDNDQLFKDLGFDIHYIGEVDDKGHEFGYEDLEDGDIVVAYRTDTNEKGHVEFYINDRYGKNGNGTYDWSFGWGSQKSRYPVNGNIGKIIKVDESKEDNDNQRKYLLDNFTNIGNGKAYDLRYFKVLRKVR